MFERYSTLLPGLFKTNKTQFVLVMLLRMEGEGIVSRHFSLLSVIVHVDTSVESVSLCPLELNCGTVCLIDSSVLLCLFLMVKADACHVSQTVRPANRMNEPLLMAGTVRELRTSSGCGCLESLWL